MNISKNKKFDIIYFSVLFLILVGVFYPSFSNPPVSDGLEMFYTFHNLDEKPGPIKWLHVLNHDPYEKMRYQPLSHMFYYIFHLAFGSNYHIYNIFNFLFYFISLLVLYKFALRFSADRKITALFISLFAFLFSHCDILLWNCHIYIIIGFTSFLIGFIKYTDFLKTGKIKLLFSVLFFFIFGMLCYESFWLWPFGIIIISFVDEFKKTWQGIKKKLLKINSLFLSIFYTLYISLFFLTRFIGTYEKPVHSIFDFLKLEGFIKAGFLSFLNIIYNNLAVNIAPLLTFPLRIEENLYFGGFVINSINRVEGGNTLLINFIGGLGIILIFSIFVFLYRKKYFYTLKIGLFLFFLLFVEIYTVIFCRLVTNTDVVYSLVEPRYQYIPNALVVVFLVLFFTKINLFKTNKFKKTLFYCFLALVFVVNIFCIQQAIDIYNRDLKNLKTMIANIKVGMTEDYINKNKKLFLAKDLPDYLPSLCWNIDMGDRFIQGTYEWLFSRKEIKYFAENIDQASWVIDKENFKVIDKHFPDAFKEIKKIVKGKGQASIGIGYFYLDKENYPKAEFMFRRAVADAQEDEAYVGLGILYSDLKKYDLSYKMFKTAKSINPRNLDVYIGLGYAYSDQKKYKQAECEFIQALNIDSRDDKVYIGLGYCYLNQDEIQKAKNAFKKAIELDDDVYAYIGLGYCLQNLDEPTKAEEAFRKAINLDKDNFDAYIGLGWVYHEQGDNKKASEYFQKSIEFGANETGVYVGLGYCFKDLGKFLEAEEMFKKAIDIDNKEAEAYIGLGWVYREQAKNDKAQKAFQQGLALDDNKVEIYTGLGYCLKDLKNLPEAEKMFKKTIDIDKDNIDAYIGLGWVNMDRKEYNLAKSWFKRAIKINPKHADAYIGLGYYYKEKKNYERAEFFLLKAKKLNPEDFWAYLILGSIYYDQGLTTKAQVSFKEAKKINPILFKSIME